MGLSGGVDSALTAAIAAARWDNVIGVTMPSCLTLPRPAAMPAVLQRIWASPFRCLSADSDVYSRTLAALAGWDEQGCL